MAVSNQEVADWLRANPMASDAEIAQAAASAGVSPQQLAQVTGVPVEEVQQRITAAMPSAPTASPTTTAPTQAPTEPWNYDSYVQKLKSGDNPANEFAKLGGVMGTNAQNIYNEILAQQKAGSSEFWYKGNTSSPEAAAADFALRLAENGIGSLNDLGQSKVFSGYNEGGVEEFADVTINKATGEPLPRPELLGRGTRGLDLDYNLSFAADGTAIPFTSNRESSWVNFRENSLKPAAAFALATVGAPLIGAAVAPGLSAATQGAIGGAIAGGGSAALTGNNVLTGALLGGGLGYAQGSGMFSGAQAGSGYYDEITGQFIRDPLGGLQGPLNNLSGTNLASMTGSSTGAASGATTAGTTAAGGAAAGGVGAGSAAGGAGAGAGAGAAAAGGASTAANALSGLKGVGTVAGLVGATAAAAQNPITAGNQDLIALANATAKNNLEMAKYTVAANRFNQSNQYGQSNWTYTPTYDANGNETGGGWSQKTTLNPEQQKLFDSQTAGNQGLSDTANTALRNSSQLSNPNLDFSKLPEYQGLNLNALPSAPITPGMTAQQAAMSRLQPTLNQYDNALSQRLANQGITLGSEAYNREMNLAGQRRNDLELQSAYQGISLDQAARQQALGEQQALYNQTSNQRGQMLNEQQSAINTPLNTINALRSGSQVANPQFQNLNAQQANVAGADVLGAGQAQQTNATNASNAQRAQNAGIFGGLAQLGTAAVLSPPGTFSGLFG